MLAPLLCLLTGCSAATAVNDVFYRCYQGNIDQYSDVPSGNPAKFYETLNSSQPTAIYIHGWMEDCKNASAANICSAALSRGGYNVCCLDWSALAKQNYLSAACSTATVASILSKDVIGMSNLGFQQQLLKLLGFSLGAHVAGFTGYRVQQAGLKKVGQITGLDPALPLMYPIPTCLGTRHLEPTDADLVFPIHTSGGTFGVLTPTGKCDAYPNYGVPIQKDCDAIPTTLDLTKFLPTYRCNHDKAWMYYADAIRNPGTHVCLFCDSAISFATGLCSGNPTLSIDLDMPKNISGTCYYITNAKYPYGRSEQGTISSIP